MPQVTENREQVIIRTSKIGILANLLLAGFKAAVGLLSHSIAVVLDAVNNLTDAISSIVTIVGARLAARNPDKKHPLGHGRIEYLSATVVAALVIYAGITALVESIKKIIAPEKPDYSVWSLVIIAAAVVTKVLLGRYVKKTGERVNSASLAASGQDALSDAVLSFSVLGSPLIFFLSGLSLEAYVGVVIAVFIIRAGYGMLSDTLNDILGRRPSAELTDAIKKTICEDPQALGAYDLILHSYGPEKVIGSVHVEIPAEMTAEEIDRMARRVTGRVLEEHGILLTAVGIYAVRSDEKAASMREKVTKMALAHEGVLQTHGFYLDDQTGTVTFDMIIDYDIRDRQRLYQEILEELKAAWPGYTFHVTIDIDI